MKRRGQYLHFYVLKIFSEPIVFIVLSFPLLMVISLSCSKEEMDKPYLPIDEVSAGVTLLIPDKITKRISTTIHFANLPDIKQLVIKKNGGSAYSQIVKQDQLSNPYLFDYLIEPSDPEFFQFILYALYQDGNRSKQFILDVDNRWGFFVRKVERVARVTGNPITGETFISPNKTALNWNVGGTDLGVIWEMDPGKYGLFFGDTFGRDFKPDPTSPGPNGSSWRSNVLGFSDDHLLEDGLTLNNMAEDERGDAREIIYGGKDTSGNGNWTSIPTAAVRANGIDYVHYFNMRNWTGWITNYSGYYKSMDQGQNWTPCETIVFSSDSHFGQVGFFKQAPYVYMIGTETGRHSMAYLSRFKETNIEDKRSYEFWNRDAGEWIVGDESMATALIEDKVGELSFLYNETFGKWIIAYFSSDRYNITLRTADEITGPWSEPYELASGDEYPQLYGSYFHPLSVKGETLYFTMSIWMPYNVFLMKAELAEMGEFFK